MNKLTQEVIDKLAGPPDGKVVSIYLPTHRYPSSPYMTEDQTRFKNLIQQAKSLVEADDNHNAILSERLDELEKKIDDTDFWQSTIEALAIFVSSERVLIYHLPFECEEYVSYAESYMTAPLIMLQAYNEKFYVLSLSVDETKLYEADMYNMQEVDINLRHSVENDPSDGGRQERLLYFKAVDDALSSHKSFDMNLPLVVAGSESDVRDFHEHTKLKNIASSTLEGDYSHLGDNELHALVWPLVCRDAVSQKEQDIVEQVNELQGSGKASTQLDEIEAAARDDRIEALLVPLIDLTHDSVTDRTDEAPVVRMSSDENGRLNQIVQMVHRFGGKVFGVDSEAMPNGSQAAAVYRY